MYQLAYLVLIQHKHGQHNFNIHWTALCGYKACVAAGTPASNPSPPLAPPTHPNNTSILTLRLACCTGSHDNIVGLRGLCQHEDDLYLVMEYCPRGTLDLMLHHSTAAQWDSAKLVSLVRSIARGMLHLHTRKPPMLHRDLKPGNIFVGKGEARARQYQCV